MKFTVAQLLLTTKTVQRLKGNYWLLFTTSNLTLVISVNFFISMISIVRQVGVQAVAGASSAGK